MTDASHPNDRDKLTTRQRLVLELLDRLRKAEAVMRSLDEARREADQQARDLKRADVMKAVTGLSGIEKAMQATSRMVDMLKREISEASARLSQIEVRRLRDLGSLSLTV